MGNRSKILLSSNNENRSQSLIDCHNTKNIQDLQVNNCDLTYNSFNTWPEKISKCPDTNETANLKHNIASNDCDENDPNKKTDKNCKHVQKCGCLSLNEALESFKIAYNPQTKQLEYSLVDNKVQPREYEVKDTDDDDKSKVNGVVELGFSVECVTPVACDTAPISLTSTTSSLAESTSSSQASVKKNKFSDFFTRNVFSSTGSWRLFGSSRSKNLDEHGEDLVASSSALIQHIRPVNLPAKNLEEDRRHRDEYKAMLEAAKRKEAENTKSKKKKQEQQLRFEEQLSAAAKCWTTSILPAWDTMQNCKKTKDLWWQGLPPSVRGRIWCLALGNELNVTHELYSICKSRAEERLRGCTTCSAPFIFSEIRNSEQCIDMECVVKNGYTKNKNPVRSINQESSMEVIRLDISRTFPSLGIFQQSGPYFTILHELLAAYVCYRPDIGYVQGMSFVAAVLILNMEPSEAFVCFANLLNRPLLLAAFTLDQVQMKAYYLAFDELLKESLPRLSKHFLEAGLTPDLYLLDWVYTVFAKAMPLDVACRVWDVFMRDGDEFIFKTALGVLSLHQDVLLKMDFLDGAQFLTHLPEDLSAEQLFRHIQSVSVSITKHDFNRLVEKCRASISESCLASKYKR